MYETFYRLTASVACTVWAKPAFLRILFIFLAFAVKNPRMSFIFSSHSRQAAYFLKRLCLLIKSLTSSSLQATMWWCWTHLVLAWVSMATPTLCQSGDWGSGFEMEPAITATNETSRAAGDEPVRIGNHQDWMTSAAFSPPASPELRYGPQPDKCSVHFSTTATSARRLKAQREQLAYLQAVQHANKAVIENLEQFVGAELGDQTYEDLIRENVVGIAEDNSSCHEVVEKAEEDMQKQLEGEESSAGMQR